MDHIEDAEGYKGDGEKIKVDFDLSLKDWHGIPVETMWALIRDTDKAQILNVPFFAKKVSCFDIVLFKRKKIGADLERLVFTKLYKASGHSTYRIRFDPTLLNKIKTEVVRELKALGCLIEFGGEHLGYALYAIDIPSSVDIDIAYSLLEKFENLGDIEIEEGNDVHPKNG
jgi:hypothetical protein